jgi:hypothetical protein
LRAWRERALGIFPSLRPLVWLCGLVVLAHTVRFILLYFRAVPWMDYWDWVGEYQDYTQGHFGLAELISQHNEHRIATARVFFLLDAVFFRLTSFSVVIANFLLLLLLGYLLRLAWRLPALRGTPHDLPWIAFAAFVASLCQWEDLIWPFQIQFALMCVFVVGAALALSRATAPEATRRNGVLWASCAATCYWFATFSMAGGMLALPGLLLIPVLRQFAWRPVVAFLLPSLGAVASFLSGFHHPGYLPLPQAYTPAALLQMLRFAAAFCGGAFHVHGHAMRVGFLCIAVSAICGTWLLFRRIRGVRATGGVAVLLALAAFVVTNAAAAAVSRGFEGLGGATAPRYAILSLVFIAATAGLAAATAHLARIPGADFALRRTPLVPVATIAAIAALNLPRVYANDADSFARSISVAQSALLANVNAPEMTDILTSEPESRIDGFIRFLHDKRLNIFASPHHAPEIVRRAVETADQAVLPACAGGADIAYRVDADRFVIGGWLAPPDRQRTVGYVGIRQGGNTLAVARSLVDAPDAAISQKHGQRLGFLIAAHHDAGNTPLTLIGVTGGKALCATQAAPPGPVLIQPWQTKGAQPVPGSDAPALSGDFAAATPPADGPPEQLAGKQWTSSTNGTLSWRVTPADLHGQSLAVPFAVPPSQALRAITFTFADGTTIAQVLPRGHSHGYWRAAVLPGSVLVTHGGGVLITVRNEGAWMSVGAPLIGVPGVGVGGLY